MPVSSWMFDAIPQIATGSWRLNAGGRVDLRGALRLRRSGNGLARLHRRVLLYSGMERCAPRPPARHRGRREYPGCLAHGLRPSLSHRNARARCCWRPDSAIRPWTRGTVFPPGWSCPTAAASGGSNESARSRSMTYRTGGSHRSRFSRRASMRSTAAAIASGASSWM